MVAPEKRGTVSEMMIEKMHRVFKESDSTWEGKANLLWPLNKWCSYFVMQNSLRNN